MNGSKLNGRRSGKARNVDRTREEYLDIRNFREQKPL